MILPAHSKIKGGYTKKIHLNSLTLSEKEDIAEIESVSYASHPLLSADLWMTRNHDIFPLNGSGSVS